MASIKAFWLSTVLCLSLMFTSSLEAIWYAPRTLSDQYANADVPQIASDLAGNATVVWREFDGENTSIRAYTVIAAELTTAVVISSVPVGCTQATPQVAFDPISKTSIAVWEEFDGVNYTVKAASLPFNGCWSDPLELSIPTTEGGFFPQIAVSSSKECAVAVWQMQNGSNTVIQAATLAIGEDWTAAVDLSSPLIDASIPQVKVDGAGNAVVVWLDTTHQTVQSATLPFEGNWSLPQDLSAVGDANFPQVAINASGYAVAAWEQFNGSYFAIQASTLQFGSSWSAPVEISTPTENAFKARVAVDSSGNAIVVWEQVLEGNLSIQSAYLASGGVWAAPATLSSGAFSFNPEVTFDVLGKAYAVWENYGETGITIQSSSCPSGGSWVAATQLSQSGENSISPHITIVSPGGSILVCWEDYTQGMVKATAWIPPPAVMNVSPNSGSVIGGDTITITGRGFINVTAVYFGSTRSSFTVTSPFTISATVPPGLSGTVDIIVTTVAGTSTVTLNDQYTYLFTASTPTVTALQADHGSVRGGNPIKITGTNFVDVTQVNFGLTPALSYSVISDKLIVAIVPEGLNTVDVTVTASGGTSAMTAFSQYTYD